MTAALARNAPAGCRVTAYDGLGRLPIFNPDDEGERTPPEASVLIDTVTNADGVIVSCPEYAHGVPGGRAEERARLAGLTRRRCRQAGHAGARLAALAVCPRGSGRDHEDHVFRAL
nr:NAD(P)H-dependent oxidoreductase [Mesorhizobium mediterraneum]